MADRGQFTGRTLNGILREEVTGLGAQLTAYHLFVQTVVTEDADMADMCLLSLTDTHFKVDAVAHDIHLCRVELIEQVTIVPVVVTYGIIVFRQALLHEFLVVDVATLHTQHTV